MRFKLKRWIYPFFTLNIAEQRGTVVLGILILLITVARYLLPAFLKNHEYADPEFEQEVKVFLLQQRKLKDSLRLRQLRREGKLDKEMAGKLLKPFPFDPNIASETKLAELGLSTEQARMIIKYRNKGGRFNSKADFARIYSISESEYWILEPFIRIINSGNGELTTADNYPNPGQKKSYRQVEINQADTAELISSLAVKPWIASRIIKYRDLLGGYTEPEQLFEVYGFDSLAVSLRLEYIEVDTSQLKHLHINTDTFRTLLRHPYISYELTKYIVNRRDKLGSFDSTQQLMESNLITWTEFKKLSLYLSCD